MTLASSATSPLAFPPLEPVWLLPLFWLVCSIPRAFKVAGPATPSAVKPFFCWKERTALVVLLPYTPSTGPSK